MVRTKGKTAPTSRGRTAFTLLELILSMAVLTAILAVLVQIFSGVQRVWRAGSGDAATARMAFFALDRLAADLSSAVQSPLGGLPLAAGDEARADDARAPVLVIEPAGTTTIAAPLAPGPDVDPDGGAAFSRLAVLRRSARPVWTDDDASLRPLRRPSPRSEDALLRGLLRVRYDVVPATDGALASSAPAFSLVRTVAGIPPVPGAADPDSRNWWEESEPLPDVGISETVARNVVWFGVSVPDFLGVATNAASSAEGGFRIWQSYTTVPGDGAEPMPPLVDVVLGLVSDQTLARAASLPEGEARDRILREGLHVYERRIQIQ